MTEKILVDKRLLNVKEFCAYLGIGQTKARELLTKTDNPYTVRLNGRLYANKILLDKWIDSISGNKGYYSAIRLNLCTYLCLEKHLI